MRKFKIKNRRKRKYVKKSSAPASLSFTSTITIGIIPLVFAAVAFFTIYLISNPLTMLSLPSFSMPAMPELPEIQPMPAITLPDISPLLAAGYESAQIVMSSLLSGLIAAYHASILTLQREFMTAEANWEATGNFIIFSLYAVVGMIQFGFTITMQAVTYAAVQITQTVNALQQIFTTLMLFLIAMTNALIQSLSDFFWFLGTPFRTLGESINDMNSILAPYFTFLITSFEHGLEDLASGGESLRQTLLYLSDNVSNSQ